MSPDFLLHSRRSSCAFHFPLLLANEGVIGLNKCRTNGDEEEGHQNEHNKGRDHLDGGFGGLLFGALTPSSPQRIRVNAQGLSHAGAETIGLNECADQGANVIHASAVDEIAQGFGPGLAGAHLEIDQMKFVAEVGISVMQLFTDAHQCLVEGKASFHANDCQIERVGKPMRMRRWRSLIIRFKKKRGKKKPKAGTQTSMGTLSKPEKRMTPARPRSASMMRAPK